MCGRLFHAVSAARQGKLDQAKCLRPEIAPPCHFPSRYPPRHGKRVDAPRQRMHNRRLSGVLADCWCAGKFWGGEDGVSLIKWSEEGGRVRLGLPSDLDLPMAPALVESLRRALAESDGVDVVCDGVERVSTACLQALLAASRQATTGRHPLFAIVSPSEGLVEACADLGLADWLNHWRRG